MVFKKSNILFIPFLMFKRSIKVSLFILRLSLNLVLTLIRSGYCYDTSLTTTLGTHGNEHESEYSDANRSSRRILKT